MTLNLYFVPTQRLSQVLKLLLEIFLWCWSGSVTDRGLSAPKGCLRRYFLLKLMMVLLFHHSADIPLLVGCVFSLRVLLLLRSPLISTKPSTVLLSHLALTDSLSLLYWIHRLGVILDWWMGEIKMGLEHEEESIWWREVVKLICQQLLDAHHLASLLLLGLLGVEAILVSRWPQQTQRFRTSRCAQLSCSLVWILVLLELSTSLHFKISQDSRHQTYPSMLQNSQILSFGLAPPSSLSVFSCSLRKALWMVNSWLHYTVLYRKPQKSRSLFH